MSKIVSVVNHKGGVGKTTTAVNVAAGLGELGNRVLLVDLDPLGSASTFLGVEDDGKALFQALQKTNTLPVIREVALGLDLVASGPTLASVQEQFSGALGAELLTYCLKQMGDEWQWIIVDCPPSLGVLTLNALMASRHVVIPVEASPLAFRGMKQMIQTIQSVRKKNDKLDIDAIVPCRVHARRRVHSEIMEDLDGLFPGKITPAVRETASLAEAPGKGRTIFKHAPRSNGAEDYRLVTQWLVEHLMPATIDTAIVPTTLEDTVYVFRS